jgi:hypothetical protein
MRLQLLSSVRGLFWGSSPKVVDGVHCTLKLFPDCFIHHALSGHPRLALKCFCYYINAETHR